MLHDIFCSKRKKQSNLMERCKGSVKLLNSRANKAEDLFLRDGYLIPCKPYPKGLPLSMPPLVLGCAALALDSKFNK